ncbi:hypothetical protein I3842_13G154300 [Carya illinoinensis]|uniref:DDT domain-containing protein PTM-like n=1 Tax=Carya illinoinensis TaxID=32201 RepID=A0A922DE10_CARIL|nr:hypothetical protein I3842_13G154300 [Carya illinoinensis]
MEFLGRSVKKEFKGFGVFSGTVRSYDASSGLFEIVYEDGGSEELEFAEVASLFEGREEASAASELPHEKPRLGRKTKKRRRIERMCEVRSSSGNLLNTPEEDLRETVGTCGNLHGNGNLNDGFVRILEMGHRFGGNLRENVEVNLNLNINIEQSLENASGFGVDLKESVSVSGNVNGKDNLKDGFDLNAGLNVNEQEVYLKDGCDTRVKSEESPRKRDCIDLNLDVSGDFDENLTEANLGYSVSGNQKKNCDFDLNLEVCEDIKDPDGDDGVEFRVSNSSRIEETQKKEIAGDVEEKCEEDGVAKGSLEKLNSDINDSNSKQEDVSGSLEATVGDVSLVLAEGLEKEIGVCSQDLKAHRSLGFLDDSCIKDRGSMEVQLEDGLSEAGATVVHGDQGGLGSPCTQGSSRRKRRRQADNLKSITETVLRRSSRRGSAQNRVAYSFQDPLSSSPAVSVVTEEMAAISGCEASENTSVLPPKPQLPPSSQNLNLDDIPVLDLFSVYACLRSFSTLLFLSPFELEDFVTALKCKSPSTLFDCIHLSILQTLRKHLEYLSNEGSESASDCLRSLNWDLLDLITWPIFMAEYLLIHGSELKPGFDISRLKLFRTDYYKQPASVKVEVLRCLSDDMIEVEAIRSELSRRSLIAEPDMVFDRSMNLDVYKKRRVTADVSVGSCLTEEIVEDTTDWNSDDCCLCKMDGNLICCDGCPAAYHSKCVGISSDLLPEGDWYCPECAIDRCKPWMKHQKSPRGAELLGIDPHGRLFFSSCGYLLVSESRDTESAFSYYHRNDLSVVIEVLKTSDIFYSGILYPENSEYAKRSRYVAWRAAVETASSVEQLAFQVRELDTNIKWDDIENSHSLPALDKQSVKSIRLFKKVIIRRKCTEGEVVKYLLDFGKRRAIPDIVKRHGSLVEKSSSERKTYWLAECYVPLHLLKNFEEKRLARKSFEMKSAELLDCRVKKRSPQKRGFSYLFSKAERSEYYQCGHCNKDVLIREALSCLYCKGFFHKRHVRKSAGVTAECTYTCHQCHDGTRAKIDPKRRKTGTKGGKLLSQKNKKVSKDCRSVRLKCRKKTSKGGQIRSQNSKKALVVVPLRRSPRKAKCLTLQNKKRGGRRKAKQIKSRKSYKKPKRSSSWRKKRTHVYQSYWLNGLLLSRKPNDERVMHFREKNILVPSDNLSLILDQPKCHLCCEAGCASTLSYILCETCGEWFHGDAFGLTLENIDKLIGFRCHICRKRDPPICPHLLTVKTDVSQLVEAQGNALVECNDEESSAVSPLSEIVCN